MTARDLRNACLAVAFLLAACNSSRATSDASTTGHGGATGSAGSIGTGGVAGTTGTGGVAGTTGTGGGGGTGGGAGTGGTDSGDAGTTACGDAAACTASEVCLLNASGGASYVCPDAGHATAPPNCDGRVTDVNGCCYGAESWTYRCVARPSGCGATVTCACAKPALCTSTCEERGPDEIGCWQVGP